MAIAIKHTSKICEIIFRVFLLKCSKNPPKCSQKCEKIIPECGHPCQKSCGEPCGGCDVLIMSSDSSACGHGLMTKCGDKNKSDVSSICEQRCRKELRCGHVCERICGIECLHGKLHAPCKEPCQRRLICGHDCNGKCLNQKQIVFKKKNLFVRFDILVKIITYYDLVRYLW